MYRTLVFYTLLVGLCSSAAAQGAPVDPGTRVRVWPAVDPQGHPYGTPTVGALSLWTADSLVLDTRNLGVLSIPHSAVAHLEQSGGRKPRGPAALKGAGVGLLIGAGAGAMLALLGEPDEEPCGIAPICLTSRGAIFGFATMVFGVPAALLGGAIGALVPGERWKQVSLPTRVGITPRTSGLALSASFGF